MGMINKLKCEKKEEQSGSFFDAEKRRKDNEN
jgi:hypothetical protein